MATYESIYQLSPATRMCRLSLMIWIPSLMESKSYQPFIEREILWNAVPSGNFLSHFERIHTSRPYASQEVFALTILVCLQQNLILALLLAPKDRYPSWWMVPREPRVVLGKKTPSCSYTFKIRMKYPSMKLRASLPLKICLLIFQPAVFQVLFYTC